MFNGHDNNSSKVDNNLQKLKKAKKSNSRFFLGSLPGNMDGVALLGDYFSYFGEVISIEVIKNPKTHLSKGYGFLSISLRISEEEFVKVHHFFQGRFISVRKYIKGKDLAANTENFLSKRLFVKSIPEWMTQDDLQDYFKQFGPIEMAYLTPNYAVKQVKSQIGLVHFKNQSSIEDVLRRGIHYIKGIAVKCSAFESKKGIKRTQENKTNGHRNEESIEQTFNKQKTKDLLLLSNPNKPKSKKMENREININKKRNESIEVILDHSKGFKKENNNRSNLFNRTVHQSQCSVEDRKVICTSSIVVSHIKKEEIDDPNNSSRFQPIGTTKVSIRKGFAALEAYNKNQCDYKHTSDNIRFNIALPRNVSILSSNTSNKAHPSMQKEVKKSLFNRYGNN